MNYMLKGLWLIEDGPYVGDTNFISTRPMLSRSSLRLVLKLFNNYYNFWQQRGSGKQNRPYRKYRTSRPSTRGRIKVL